jgi:uncharacterized membrane protein YraQ (UPF0718 family)
LVRERVIRLKQSNKGKAVGNIIAAIIRSHAALCSDATIVTLAAGTARHIGPTPGSSLQLA